MIDRVKEQGGKSTEAQSQRENTVNQGAQGSGPSPFVTPSISLPKGGGAIRGIGEKFGANPVTGTGLMTVPIAVSLGRSGFGPQLALSYDSGAGNGPFGLGWNLSLPAITRKTDKGLPKYQDAEESDVFILSGAEDLVPAFKTNPITGEFIKDDNNNFVYDESPRNGYLVRRYRPRIEGLFARIERWTRQSDGDVHWRSISKDNITTFYGKTQDSRIANPEPEDASQIFSWLICQSYDDKGNAIVYEYQPENSKRIFEDQQGQPVVLAHERNRNDATRSANRYLKRIKYGNRKPNRDEATWDPIDPTTLPSATWMFEIVFDYGDEPYVESPPDAENRVFAQSTISALPGQSWTHRYDPFSTYRSGFEVRTYRLCRRAMMFHHFPDELGVDDYLVRSTEFTYDEKPIASFITKITQSGYVRQQNGSYLKRSLPPVEFEYSKAEIQNEVRELDAESLENLPTGLDGANYQWIDLDGDGVAGIMTEQAGAWFYKRNLSPISTIKENGATRNVAKLAPVETVTSRPSFNGITSGGMQFLDLAGDGRPDLVQFDGSAPGFFEHTDENIWEPHRPFTSLPNVNWRDPNLKFIDLSGDGHADILISEDEVFTWYPSLAEDGFGPSVRVHNPFDEEKGPRLVFAEATQTIFLADMSGDGLTDLVRIRNGEVCYWPNLGYGRFGEKVTMDDSPWFDAPDLFDPRRIRLADIDGSGVTDMIYLGRYGIHLYFNQSGNGWGKARTLDQFPRADNLSSVTVVDLLGNGTACLVWSSPLPGNTRRPMRYIDLMGGTKPHLLIKSVNNLGAETRVQYAPSTKFYLADKRDGRPWVTRLPFPVHVVERVETYDHISRNRFITSYAYHHGYFDGEEREFRAFGMVEQLDTEEFAALSESGTFPIGDNSDESSHVPPVLTRTWFHTGVYLGRERVSDFFAGLLDANDKGEYYRELGLTDAQTRALLLDDTVLPGGLTVEEEREACRAIKGSMLRQEVYALDGTGTEEYPYGHPYTVTEQNFTIRLIQPRRDNRHGVFFTHARESLSYHYEREPSDPRIGHALTLEVDDFGNVLNSAAIGYGRRERIRVVDNQGNVTEAPNPGLNALEPRDQAKQTQILITYTENRVTKDSDTGEEVIDAADDYRTPLPSESRTYELTDLTLPEGRSRFAFEEILDAGTTAIALDYEKAPTPGQIEKRLIEHVRIYYRRNDLAGPLPLGELQSLALPFESYKLAFTPELVAEVYGGRASDSMFETEGRYVHTEGDANWWIPSGRIFYSPDPDDTPPEELDYARQRFFLPHRYRDTFHTDAVSTESFVIYDRYDLLVQETRDALGNRVTVGERNLNPTQPPVQLRQDYRVLQPALVMDPNRNCSEVVFDALGMVVGAAVMGKPEENPRPGDRLTAAFRADLTQSEIDQFLADPKGPMAATLLADATTRIVYDLTAWWREPDPAKKPPAVAATLARETHYSEPIPAGELKIQISLSYSDGFGREIQKKIQAEPGPVPMRDANGKVVVGADCQPQMTPNDVSPRWVGSSWTVFNNKGKSVRQYEPFFTDRHRFEFDVRIGVSPVLFYDPVERVVATLHPNHTWEKVVFDSWRQEIWDVNDTVPVADPKADPDVGDFFRRLPDSDYIPTWHALRTDPAHAAAIAARYPNPTDRTNETRAAEKTRVHAATPTVAHADSLGRTFLTVAHNKFKYSNTPPADPPIEEFHSTRIILDIEGNQREVIDAKDRVVMRYDYDMLGNRVHQAGMEAGERWMLNDVTGKPLYAWDSRNHRFRTAYDALRRPTVSFLSDGAAAEIVVGRSFYGETHPNYPNPESSNLRGKVIELRDQAGVVTSDEYDFKGNLLHSQRQLAELVDPQGARIPAYKSTVDWSVIVQLQPEVYTSRMRYDALNRPTQLIAPHSDQPGATVNVIQPIYNEANLLEQVHAWLNRNAEPAGLLGPATANLHAVTDIDYDAKGQRKLIAYGNGAETTYHYDPLTFRLAHMLTRRDAVAFPDDCPQPPPAGWSGCQVQNLRYTYDPAGNITHIRDDAQQTIYFRNTRVEPSGEYTYDAIYRLIEAAGREHLGQVGGPQIPHSYNDERRVGLPHPNDGNAMARYCETYAYDAVGNFLEMIHRDACPGAESWRRTYAYNETSQLEPGKQSNRLTSATIGGTTETYSTDGDGYDAHGNMLRMPHLQVMQWDFKDQLRMTQRQAVNPADAEGVARQGERTWYVYDSTGQRVRKVTELAAGQVKDERIYIGGFEIYSKNGANLLVRETLHIMDDKQRVALVETRIDTIVPEQLIRYQFGNHLGSASLELDEQAQIISYEEYSPYGNSTYQAVRSQTEAAKRYRYTGKERDEESGLYYMGARYCAPWLGRWLSPDPAGPVDGTNLYVYARNNPVRLKDPTGTNGTDFQLPMPETLQPRSGADRMVQRLSGTFLPAPTFTIDPSLSSLAPPAPRPDIDIPYVRLPSGGGGQTPPSTPEAPPKAQVVWEGLPINLTVIPPDERRAPRFHLNIGFTSASLGLSHLPNTTNPDAAIRLGYNYGNFVNLDLGAPQHGANIGYDPLADRFRVQLRTTPTEGVRFDLSVGTPGRADAGIPSLSLGITFGAGRPITFNEQHVTSTGATAGQILADPGAALRGARQALDSGFKDLSFGLTPPPNFTAIGSAISSIIDTKDAALRHTPAVELRGFLGASLAPWRPPGAATTVTPLPDIRVQGGLQLLFDGPWPLKRH